MICSNVNSVFKGAGAGCSVVDSAWPSCVVLYNNDLANLLNIWGFCGIFLIFAINELFYFDQWQNNILLYLGTSFHLIL